MSDPVVLLSTGDVVGPAGGVTDNSMVLFSGTSGKLIKGNNAVVTAAGLAILDDVNAAAQRVTLGLGTAATANVTTSPIDTTAGRVLKVGDFGLGTTSVEISNIDSLSIPTGFYIYGDATAGLKPSAYGTITITVGANGIWVTQLAYSTNYGILTRSNINNTGWAPWQEIALTNSPAFTGTPTAPTPSIGTRSTAIATMQNFANEFGSSLAANGHQKLPSGLIIQWGVTGSMADGSSAIVTLPVTFPSANLFVMSSINADVSGDATNVRSSGAQVVSNSQIRVSVNASAGYSYSAMWFAIGF